MFKVILATSNVELLAYVVTLFFCFLGLAVGSFINALEWRLSHGKGKTILNSRSMCPKCKHTLGFWDLIPLLSFVLLKAKCRYCKRSISWQYPIVEFLNLLIFCLVGFKLLNSYGFYGWGDLGGFFVSTLVVGLIFSSLLFIALYDLKHQLIPNVVVLPLIVTLSSFWTIFALLSFISPTLLAQFFPRTNYWVAVEYFAAALGYAFVIFSAFVLTKGKGMGAGDVKLAFLSGLILGLPGTVFAFYISIFSALIVGLIYALVKGKLWGLRIPLGTFMVLGNFFAWLFSTSLAAAFPAFTMLLW